MNVNFPYVLLSRASAGSILLSLGRWVALSFCLMIHLRPRRLHIGGWCGLASALGKVITHQAMPSSSPEQMA